MGTLFACLSMLMQRSLDMNGYEGAIQKIKYSFANAKESQHVYV